MTDQRGLPEGIVTFLLTDIEGSTALLRRLGPAYDRMIEQHHTAVRARMGNGVEVRAAGDGFIFAFRDAGEALDAAVDAQRVLLSQSWPDDATVRVRMGLHRGDARVIDGDYVSLALHQAVRVCTAANGGQIVVSPDVAAVVSATDGFIALEGLGSFFVRDFDGPVELFEVRHPDIPVAVAPPRVPPAAVHNLPPQRTSFVGRGFETGELAKLLDTAALTTLVGPGGVGKTRLATEVALLQAGSYTDGVWLVGLQSASSGDDVPSVVARALRISEGPAASPTDAIVGHLADRHALVVVDNCEHVIDDAAALIDAVLSRCENVRVLATSREPLALPLEHVFRVEPLAVPGERASVDEILGASAVELFVQRARQVDRNFEVSDAMSGTIAEICRGLDGIPLAIELTASRLASIEVVHLVDDLRGAGLLDVGRRGGDERQRTLRNTIAWSYDLLTDRERTVFTRCAPFRGGYTIDALSQIDGGDDVGAVLAELASRSLIEPQPDFDPPRFRLLEPVRVFVAERLAEHGDAPTVELAFATWCADLVNAMQQRYSSPDQSAAMERVGMEYDNVRAAFEIALAQGSMIAAYLARDTMTFCWIRGYWREAIGFCRRSLTLELDDHLHAQVLVALAQLEIGTGDLADAKDHLRASAELYAKVGDDEGLAACLATNASRAMRSDEREEAVDLYRRAADAFRAIGSEPGEARCLADLGVLHMRTDTTRARELLMQALELYRRAGHGVGEAGAYNLLGQVAFVEEDLDEAVGWFTKAHDTALHVGLASVVAAAQRWLGSIAHRQGRLDEAEPLLRAAADAFAEMGEANQGCLTECDLARLLAALGRTSEAFEHMRAALRMAAERSPSTVWLVILSIARLLAEGGALTLAARLAVAVEAEGQRIGRSVLAQPELLTGLLDRARDELGDGRLDELRAEAGDRETTIELALVATVGS